MTTPESSPFLSPLRTAIRVRHYSIPTEMASVDWIKRFIHFNDWKYPTDRGEPEVVAFLSDLAVSGNVPESTRNQALNALCFLYKHGLERGLAELRGAVGVKESKKLPVV
ncbi:MAG: phage integrase N-terminal SAM-like domain-containing protein [Methylococcales bacterium]